MKFPDLHVKNGVVTGIKSRFCLYEWGGCFAVVVSDRRSYAFLHFVFAISIKRDTDMFFTEKTIETKTQGTEW